jgi:thiazolylpeptide-type bacteriocin precursor
MNTHKLDALSQEISRLESETFEIADYSDANDLFALSSCSTSSCSSTTSSTCA